MNKMPSPFDTNASTMDAAVDSNTMLSPSSNNAAAMLEVKAHPSSSSSPPAAANDHSTDVTAHHPRDDEDEDVAMDGTTKNDSSGSTATITSNDDDDVEMTPQEDEPQVVVHPKHSTTMNDLESPSSAPPSEQTEFIPASTLTNADDKTKDLKEVSVDHSMADEEMNNPKLPDASVLSAADQKRLGDILDGALDKLQHSISEAILAFRKDSQSADDIAAQEAAGDATVNNNNGSAYLTLREAALTAHQNLVEYGSSLDLSLASANANDDGDHLSMRRREKLKKIGRDLWKTIRTNPDLFNDAITDAATNNYDVATSSSSMEQKRQCVIAGGYIRGIAVRLIFLDYIDTRCSKACPPRLHDGCWGGSNKACTPSPKELVFGLKLLSKGGRAILQHGKNARDSHDLLSIAISFFNGLSSMAQRDGEAANEVKDVLLDEAFDVLSALPSAAALFEQSADSSTKQDDMSTQADTSVGFDWPTIALKHLNAAKAFIDVHCDEALSDENKSTLKYAALQRFLPQLAKLCLKQGSRFAAIGVDEHAKNALNIALATTNKCLSIIKAEKERTPKKSEAQMLQNLEADMVVVSIESLYILSSVLQSLGRKQDAITCLDRVEEYMNEKHEKDEQLYGDTVKDLGNGSDFMFSEDAFGPAQDKTDIRNRAQTALSKSRDIHSREKATLSFRRIQLFNADDPSEEDELCIDNQLRSMVELVSKRPEILLVETKGHKETDIILKLTLQAFRRVHVRRKMLGMSSGGGEDVLDTYRFMFDQISKSHHLRPVVILDKLSAALILAFEVRRSKLESEYESIDAEAIVLADQYVSSLKHDNAVSTETTLFVDTKNSLKLELLGEAKEHFGRAVSLYHSWDAHEMCAKWARMLKDLHETHKATPEHEEDQVIAGVLSILAHSLSMSGNYAEGMKMAREAWKNQKCVNNLVTLFLCATKHKQADTLLEFDTALNELSPTDHNSILEHFPRFSNACVENEADGGGEILLGVQERWLNLLLSSKNLSVSLEKKKVCDSLSDHSVLDLLSAYLENFEHVSASQVDSPKLESMCDYLGLIIDGVLRLLQVCRDRKQEKLTGRRRKKTIAENSEDIIEFDSIWNDKTTQTLLGERSQCVWVAETLWNIGNQLMAASVLDDATYDSRALAADLFAASHDFILMSEEEEGARLSKLDYDVKYEPEKFTVPSFNNAPSMTMTASEISSEFSAQTLLVSAAVTVDYLEVVKDDQSSAKSLLRRTLHRLAQSQQEYESNRKKTANVSKMIALLTMRCLISIGEDSFAFETCKSGLCDKLLKHQMKEAATPDEEFHILKHVKIMADLALQKRMTHTERVLTKLCSDVLQQSNNFVVNLGEGIVLSLGDLKRKMIQSAVTVEEAIQMFQEIDDVVKKAGNEVFSAEDFAWFTIEAHTKGVQLSMIGDDDKAKIFFSFSLNFVKFSTKEVQGYKNEIMNAFTKAVQKPKTMCF